MGYKETYNRWLTSDVVDDDTKAELKSIENNEKEIEERFYRELEFGTAGMRGIIGAGTNRINIYNVRRASQGVAKYVLSNGEDAAKAGVLIRVTIHVIFHAHLLKKQLRFLLVRCKDLSFSYRSFSSGSFIRYSRTWLQCRRYDYRQPQP